MAQMQSHQRRRAGLKNQRVTIQTRNETSRDAMGGISPTWEDTYREWAYVRPARGREFEAAASTQGQILWLVTLNYDNRTKSLSPKNRLRWDNNADTTLEILRAWDVDGLRKEIELECVEAAA